ncbi:MAG: transcription termination/antitermination protein NusA [Anaerolineales bacterium]|nr:transcription termination/antitermination protein NusA [Anaerolineales bacterium]
MVAVNQVCHERQLPIDIVLEAVEVALISAYKRNYSGNHSITAQIEPKTGKVSVFTEKMVVEAVQDERNEVSLEQAKAINPRLKVGELISIDSTPDDDFGRIAAQTAKQVILQRIREAERDALYNTYAEREGEIVNGTVHKIDPHQVTLSLGKVEAFLPRSEQIPTERYSEGQRLRAYVASVAKASRGPQIIVSRTHRNMLRRLLEVEVPEIYNGTVEIKSIAREAGYRSKVAVAALQEGVDPVGSCVGMRGTRIQSIVNELNGEKIDVVQWNPDLSFFIANALSPARVMNVMLSDEKGKTAVVVVPDKQLSLAIGKEGQNARLAAKLTGWRIDIKSASEAIGETIERLREDKALRERLAGKVEIFNMASIILKEKEPVEYSDAELNVLSQAIESVNLAEMAIRRESKARQAAEAEAAKQAAKTRDILAEAEAILTGQSPLVAPVEEAPVEAVAEVEPAVEAEALETEAAAEVEVQPEAVAAPGVEPEIKEPGVETETVPVSPQPEPPTPEPVAGEWSEEETDDSDPEKERDKKKARDKKRRLVFDENLGEVVAERRRKPSRRGGWLDFEEDE